jgi:hypothetical protein
VCAAVETLFRADNVDYVTSTVLAQFAIDHVNTAGVYRAMLLEYLNDTAHRLRGMRRVPGWMLQDVLNRVRQLRPAPPVMRHLLNCRSPEELDRISPAQVEILIALIDDGSPGEHALAAARALAV